MSALLQVAGISKSYGALRVIKDGAVLTAPFLTVPVTSTDERGLLGVAIDPNFATNRFVYVYYTAASPVVNRVSRFRASASTAMAAQIAGALTNIVLDVLLNRPEFVKDSSMIWKLCETEQAKGYISTLTYANMMYVMRKQLSPDQIEEAFRKLNLIFEFADFSPAVLERAVNMKWKDFEDAVQSATAESVHADYIITRNLKDFTQSKVMAFTPTELLARI